jgi:pimeloyl-ACP methyl ester carboxylesterase
MSSRRQRRLYRQQNTSEHTRSSTVTATDWTADAKGAGQYANVNDINLYFETHGAGRPMILLHGGLGSGEMFGPILPTLAKHHQVIAVDLQGHGRTADIDRPIDVRLMADDIAALIDHLELDKPDVVGYSLGGGVALQTAVKYPAKVRRLVSASANIRRDATYPDMLAQQGQVNAAAAEFMKDTPMYQLYQRVAPRPEDFPRLLDKMGEGMAKDFDFSEDVRGLQVPTLIVAADADMAPPSHYTEVFRLLGGGLRDGGWMGEGRPDGGHALAILPGLTHYNVFSSPLFAAVTLNFLDGQPS